MLNKLALSIVLLVMPSLAFAGDGKFTYVEPGMEVPFRGTLFDNDATAHLLTLPEYYEIQCDLELEYQMGLLIEKHNFEKSDLQAQIEFVQTESSAAIMQKDSRIELLEAQLEKRNKNNRPYIFAGGVAVGIALTMGILRGMEQIR